MSSKLLTDFESDVSGAATNMVGISDAEVDMADIQISEVQDAEMVRGYKSSRWISGNDMNETQPHIGKGQIIRWHGRYFWRIHVLQVHKMRLSFTASGSSSSTFCSIAIMAPARLRVGGVRQRRY